VSSCRVPSIPLKSFRRNRPLRWTRRLQIDVLLLLLVSDLGWDVDTDWQMPASPITRGADALSVSCGKRREVSRVKQMEHAEISGAKI
jgi:hypothetical protein